MERKLVWLITVFSVLFVLLIGIQVYFLKNSYQLKRQEILGSVKSILSSFEDDVDVFDKKILDDDHVLKLFVQLEDKKITESELREKYSKKAALINTRVENNIDSVFLASGYRVAIMKEIVGIRSRHSGHLLVDRPITVYRTKRPVSKKFVLSSSKWETSQGGIITEEQSISNSSAESYLHGYFVGRTTYFEIENLQQIVYKELAGLIMTSIMILMAVIVLFYLTYKNLLRQRKQVRVLHDMMDNITHELRTPLATLKFASRSFGNSVDPTIVGVFDRQISRLEHIVRPLETTSLKKAAYQPWTEQDIHAFLEDFRLANFGVSIHIEKLTMKTAAIDKMDVETILGNLLSNSIKYGAKEIRINLEESGDLLKLQVKDDGIGIAKKEYPFIFERYYRIQNNNVHETKGLGIGLYIVKRLVEKYKGQISVSSKLSKGTVFNVSLSYEL